MLLEDFVNELDQLWEASTPPLEKMYEHMTDPENYEVGPPDESDRCMVISLEDVHWHNGRWVMMGQAYPCYICGSDHDWHIVTEDGQVKAIFCIGPHEPTLTGFGYINTVCSIRHNALIEAVPVNRKLEV